MVMRRTLGNSTVHFGVQWPEMLLREGLKTLRTILSLFLKRETMA